MSENSEKGGVSCPVCNGYYRADNIEDHVNKCLFLNTKNDGTKRTSPIIQFPAEKRRKTNFSLSRDSTVDTNNTKQSNNYKKRQPLAEQMRPASLDEIIGQVKAFGPNSMLRSLLERKQVPNMILWGPPGCGKTSLANVIATICNKQSNLRFTKLSATAAGVNDVKEIVKVAQNEAQFTRQTVLFMDEIHRFNKLQQDTFLPYVENGTIILVGATTENPSFNLNNALLSRCRVVVMEKLSVSDIMLILEHALEKNKDISVVEANATQSCKKDNIPRLLIERASLRWLAEISDGDARIALGALELALTARDPSTEDMPALLTLDDLKEGIKSTHTLYDKGGEEHYNMASALHKSIRASDDNAALYWTTRMLHGGEDPKYIARRLVRTAAEDIGLGEPNALVEAVACMQGCQLLGMPECDVLLAQCAVRLARAPKHSEVYRAFLRCQRSIKENKGPLPSVPLHLRNAPTRLMKQLGYGHGYNTMNKDDSGLTYMPEGLENVDYFHSGEN